MNVLSFYTDASYLFNHRVSSWGFISNETLPLMQVGDCPHIVTSPFAAEAMALLKCLQYIEENCFDQKINIYTDCKQLMAFRYESVLSSFRDNGCEESLFSLLAGIHFTEIRLRENNGIDLRFYHVKAHRSSMDQRSILNRVVDNSVMKNNQKQVESSRNILKKIKMKLSESFFDIFYKEFVNKNSDWFIFYGKTIDPISAKKLINKSSGQMSQSIKDKNKHLLISQKPKIA